MTSPDPSLRVAVLGAGNGGLAAAAHLTSLGCSVRLYDLPEFGAHLPAVRERGIRIFGAVPDAVHRPDIVTTDVAEALDGVRAVLIIVPGYAQAAFTAVLLPHLRDEHALLLCPGGVGGALELYNDLRCARPACEALIGEAANLMYSAKWAQPSGSADAAPLVVRINGIKDEIPAAAVPAARTQALLAAFTPVVPSFVAARDVLDTSLNNINVVIHPPLILANLSRADAGEEWLTFRTGLTPAVARLIEECDRERLAVVRTLGLEARTVADWMRRYYPGRMTGSDFREMMSSSPVFTQSLGPRTVRDRYLEEDVPYGLVPIAAIARSLDLATPCTDGIVAIASVVSRDDFTRSGRTLERLGLAGLDRNALLARVAAGS